MRPRWLGSLGLMEFLADLELLFLRNWRKL
jgi:hypothetical protein